MTYKFTTRVKGFILGPHTYTDDLLWVEWYCYTPDQEIKGFNFRQIAAVQAYMEATANFEKPISYQLVDMDFQPITEPRHLMEDPELEFPEYFILSENKTPLQKEGMAPYMEIVWCDEDGAEQHDYNLEFPIIGKVLGV